MATLYFDFSKIYEERFIKRYHQLDFFKELEAEDITFEYYLKSIFSKYKDFYVSCGNVERKVSKEVSKDVYKNFFFRPVSDNKKEITLRCDIIISEANVLIEVKDIYLNDFEEKKKYELKISCNTSTIISNKNVHSDINLIRNIITNTPFICGKEGLDFINKWNDYLEFEKNFFSDKIGYFRTVSFQVIDLIEIKRDINSYNTYKEDIYFDDGSNYLYIRNNGLNENTVLAIEFEVEIDKNDYQKLSSFIREDIELASSKEAIDENGKLKNNTVSDIEFSFKTKRLGGLLKPLSIIEENDNKMLVTFSKFWTEEINNSYQSKERVNDYIFSLFNENPLLVNILSGDLALYKRGKQALNDLKEGNVKNPALISYLINIEESEQQKERIKYNDIDWSIKYLDTYQKNAIYKALNSSSIFLIQGPPGTGKTQVISELVYQFNKMNKKVLLSSQTHVAIDNALERLPNELDILPIRLINLERKNKSSDNFLPDKLVDNFYSKIISLYKNKQNNFKTYLEEIKENKNKFLQIETLLKNNKEEREKYLFLNNQINDKKAKLMILENDLSKDNFKIKYNKEIIIFLKEFIKNEYSIKDYKVNLDLSIIEGFDNVIKKHKINDLYNVTDNNLNTYFQVILSNDLLSSPKFIKDYKNVIDSNDFKKKTEDLEKENISLVKQIDKKLLLKNELVENIEKDNKEINLLLKQKGKVIREIEDYFKEQLEEDNSIPTLDSLKLKLIEERIKEKEESLQKEENIYQMYKPIYDDCVKFLENKTNDIEDDRVLYSRYLLNNNANVYGITCNANSKYLEEKNDYLKTLGLGNVDLKNIEFDVTIIDEVSKATPVELLIPILYSKSIILVGDHRQLPPTFKYKENMLEDISFDKRISKEKLEEYQMMVEDSLFSDLFSKTKNNKAMLINQYRSCSEIVNVINTFYDGRLRIENKEEQDKAKEHGIEIVMNNSLLFTKDISTYWLNSHYNKDGSVSYEKKLMKGSNKSTSFINEQEIYLIENVLEELDKYFYETKKDIPSIGVISLYGDQVSELRKKVKKIKFKSLDFNLNKISTVDEFQGKEEDIIILSMVRNNPSMNAGEFTKKFERINVALSRARKMLIVVGSKEFFSSLLVPIKDVDGIKKEERHVYKEVYEKIKGKIDCPNDLFD